jgi:hypothetical protein
MLDDLFKIVLDPLFHTSVPPDQSSVYPVEGYDDSENLWSAILSLH